MINKQSEKKYFDNSSSVYGPVNGRRFGKSLGIDPIFEISTCSFNCIYCQLGNIQRVTRQRKVFISTEKVLQDYRRALKINKSMDVITFSGSGEPTLASNLGEISRGIKQITPNIPQFILTNGTELHKNQVLICLEEIDKIIVKLDAPNQEIFQKINRPATGISLDEILQGIECVKQRFPDKLEIQSVFMPVNFYQVDEFAKLLNVIRPNAVQINSPSRPWPTQWHRENRGNHQEIFDYSTKKLKLLSKQKIQQLTNRLKKQTGIEIISV